MNRFLLLAAIILAIGMVVSPSFGDWLYDGTPILGYGPVLGVGYSTQEVAQPFSFGSLVSVDQIGLAIGQSADPNNVGFKVTMTEDYSNVDKFQLGVWNIHPISGGSLVFAYQDITPVLLKPNFTYYLVIEPGDTSFVGGIAFAGSGNPGYTGNGKFWNSSAPFAVRIGGTVVPEPSGLVTWVGIFVSIGFLCIRKYSASIA